MSDNGLNLSDKEISRAFADPAWAEKFPPILSVDQAAELAGVPVPTVYCWSSAGKLRGVARRVGKHLRIFRDRFIKRLFNEGINDVK
jgi:excisionase family DNA binding protein